MGADAILVVFLAASPWLIGIVLYNYHRSTGRIKA